jgi:hypothetical protein
MCVIKDAHLDQQVGEGPHARLDTCRGRHADEATEYRDLMATFLNAAVDAGIDQFGTRAIDQEGPSAARLVPAIHLDIWRKRASGSDRATAGENN